MALANLREFIAAIEKSGDLRRVTRPVSVDKEITEIADRCMKSPGGGPALLFTEPALRGGGKSRYPVAINLFGSEQRMSLALGVDCLDQVGGWGRGGGERGKEPRVAAARGEPREGIAAPAPPPPPERDFFLSEAFWRGGRGGQARAVPADLEVPAEAEIVIEGYIDPREDL